MDSLSAVRIRRLGQAIKENYIMWKDSETVVDYLNFDYIIDAVAEPFLNQSTKKKDFLLRLKAK